MCYKTLVAGSVFGNYLWNDIAGKASTVRAFRDRVFRNMAIPTRREQDSDYDPAVIRVLVHRKPLTGRHGHIIWNVDDIMGNVTSMSLPGGKRVVAKDLIVETTPLEDIIRLLSKTHVFITTPGMFYTLESLSLSAHAFCTCNANLFYTDQCTSRQPLCNYTHIYTYRLCVLHVDVYA